jgi:phosphate transport system protein
MLKLTIEIFKTKNFEKEEDLASLENEVDEMYRNHLRNMAKKPSKNTKLLISDILLTRHLERIADHACYIVEEVHYMVHGRPIYFR